MLFLAFQVIAQETKTEFHKVIGTITERDTPPNCRRSNSPPPAAVAFHAPAYHAAGGHSRLCPYNSLTDPRPTIHYPHAPDKAVAIK